MGPDEGVEALLAGLSDAQRLAVTSDAAPLCVIAGAGSGKTRTLTRRVARRVLDGSADESRTLVLTFTRKAAGELRTRLARLGLGQAHGRDGRSAVQAGTFHAHAFALLRHAWANDGRRPPAVIDRPERLLVRLGFDAPVARGLATEISWAQAQVVRPGGYPEAARRHGRRPGPPLSEVAAAFARYDEEKRRRNVLDLGDLLDRCADRFEHDATFAAAQRWRHRHFYVDEFQDLNPAQWRLLRLWLGDRDDLFVVGDPLQSIYGWNGADPDLLTGLDRRLRGLTVLRLDDNHRCSPQVLTAARSVLEPDDLSGADAMSATRPDGPAPVVRGFDDDAIEAVELARWLRCGRRPGRSWSDFAVLARTNARLDPVEAALVHAGIPCRRHDRAIDRRDRRTALSDLRRRPPDTPLRTALADLAADGDPAVRWLSALADDLALEEPAPTVGSFLAWRAASFDAEDDGDTEGDPGAGDGGAAVTLSTFHGAKGLEWPTVAVIGLEDGTAPILRSQEDEPDPEERRLLYVAMTRAEDELWCSWARLRTGGGRSWRAEPSRWVAAIESAVEPPRRVSDVEARAAIAALRATLERAS